MRTFPAGPELLDPYPFFAEMRRSHPIAFDEQAGCPWRSVPADRAVRARAVEWNGPVRSYDRHGDRARGLASSGEPQRPPRTAR